MQEILPRVDDWDIDRDLNGLLDLIEKSLLEPDERIGQSSTQESDSEHEENDEEDAEDEEGPEERNDFLPALERSASEDEKYTSLQEMDESRSSLPSALRNKGKKMDRSNLSVSFAIDMDGVRTEVANATATSEPEDVEKIQHIVIADSDDESQSTRTNDDCSEAVAPPVEEVCFLILLIPLLSVHYLGHPLLRWFRVNAHALCRAIHH
ncbi:hypothetical protein Aduo_006754 [Ancylostoma duodenale]